MEKFNSIKLLNQKIKPILLLLAIFITLITNINPISSKESTNLNTNPIKNSTNKNKNKTLNLAELYFKNQLDELISFTNKFSHGKFASKN